MKKSIYIFKVVIILFIFYCLGVLSHKNETARSIISNIYQFVFITNHCESHIHTVPYNFELIIPDSSRTILKKCRDSAMASQILRDKFKIKVPASIVFNDDTIQIKMRLKGDYSDHWSGEKCSYRIYTKNDKLIFGMRSFSIQSPETRRQLSEWYFHSLLKEEGLIALRTKYVSLIENGKLKGIYMIEESFDSHLLNNNKRKNSPILKFDESIWIDKFKLNEPYSQEEVFLMANVDVFKPKKTLKDPVQLSLYNKGRKLIDKLKNGKNKLSEIIDIDKAAKIFAIADLTGGHHALRWKNVRFYINPLIGKLELIGFDSNSGELIDDIYYNKWNKHQVGLYDVYYWKSLFFNDKEFVELYLKQLKRLSSPIFLKDFNRKISQELDTNAYCICQDYPHYNFKLDIYSKNAEKIREKIKEFPKTDLNTNNYFISCRAINKNNFYQKNFSFSIINNARKDIFILGVFDNKERLISEKTSEKVSHRIKGKVAKTQVCTLSMLEKINPAQESFKRKKNKLVYDRIKIGYKYSGSVDTLHRRIEIANENVLSIYGDNDTTKQVFTFD